MEAGRFEPLGLLSGVDAAAAVAAGIAASLAGGPLAFTLVRHAGQTVSVQVAAGRWPVVMKRLSAPVADWAALGAGPVLMGILNVTPDSFSDGGEHLDPAIAIEAGERLRADGADVIDVGGESTRPGAVPLDSATEQARVLPVVAALARAGAVVSIDTRHAATMERALDAGARIVNDVSALAWDAAAAPLLARRGCPVVLMHMRGTPATMARLATYDDVAADVVSELAKRLAVAEAAGIRRSDIAVDPGFGFAKGARDDIELLRRLPALLSLGCPIVAGLSRKSTIGRLTGETEPRRRVAGSVAAAVFALTRGARILRVHDVRDTRQAITVWRAAEGTGGVSAPDGARAS